MGAPLAVAEDSAPSPGRSGAEHPPRVFRHGRQADRGLADRPPKRSAVEVALRLRVCQAAGGGAVRSQERSVSDQERGGRSEVHADAKSRLSGQLMEVLHQAEDPRVTEDPVPFESAPYTDLAEAPARKSPSAVIRRVLAGVQGVPLVGSAEGPVLFFWPFARRRPGRREMSEGVSVQARTTCRMPPSPIRGDCNASGVFSGSPQRWYHKGSIRCLPRFLMEVPPAARGRVPP